MVACDRSSLDFEPVFRSRDRSRSVPLSSRPADRGHRPRHTLSITIGLAYTPRASTDLSKQEKSSSPSLASPHRRVGDSRHVSLLFSSPLTRSPFGCGVHEQAVRLHGRVGARVWCARVDSCSAAVEVAVGHCELGVASLSDSPCAPNVRTIRVAASVHTIRWCASEWWAQQPEMSRATGSRGRDSCTSLTV
jgi:hypothetical protein